MKVKVKSKRKYMVILDEADASALRDGLDAVLRAQEALSADSGGALNAQPLCFTEPLRRLKMALHTAIVLDA